jgi:hypothetical protein
MTIRRVLAVCVVASLASSVAPVLAQRNNDNNRRQEQRVDPDAQALAEFVDLTMVNDPLVTGMAPGTVTLAAPGAPVMRQPPPNEIAVTWQANHFIKGQSGQTYVPYTLNIDRASLPAKTAALYVRVINEAQAKAFGDYLAQVQKVTNDKERLKLVPPPYSWTSASSVDLPDGDQLQRAMALPPGKYVAFLAIKERSAAPPPQGNNDRNRNNNNNSPAPAPAAAKMGLLRHEIEVPNMSGTELTTSSVILATSVEPQQTALSQTQQEANPYVFGPMRIVPTLDGRFSKTGNLNVIFWIYGAGDAGNGKPDVTLEYNFHQRVAGAEKYFNKTQPQIVNASTLPPDFSVVAGHQVPGSLEIPLASFPAGDYRLEIKVTDKVSGKTLTQNANFTVLPV